jgi:hypothetical protein
MLHDDLQQQALELAGRDPRRPKQANLRRAVSASYYALFHFLVDQSCRQMLGTTNNLVRYRRVLARAAEHGAMKAACNQFASGALPAKLQRGLPGFNVPDVLRLMAATFSEAQDLRQRADYDLNQHFSRRDVLVLHAQVKEAIEDFQAIPDGPVKRLFLVSLFTWKTLSGR